MLWSLFCADISTEKAYLFVYSSNVIRSDDAIRTDIALTLDSPGYCTGERGVGTMRWITICERSRKFGVFGAILAFHQSLSYTAL